MEQLAHLPQMGLYYLLPVLRESPAAISRGGLCSWGAVCAASSLHSKSKGNPCLGTNRSSTRGSWGVRWQLLVLGLQLDYPWALKPLHVFPSEGCVPQTFPQKPRSPCKRSTGGDWAQQALTPSPVCLWFNRV